MAEATSMSASLTGARVASVCAATAKSAAARGGGLEASGSDAGEDQLDVGAGMGIDSVVIGR
jgi:hypothetical protein